MEKGKRVKKEIKEQKGVVDKREDRRGDRGGQEEK
jgi:hypothetical protein